MLKAQYSSPAAKINKHNELVSIGTADLSKSSGLGGDLAVRADALLGSLRGVFKAAGLDKLPANVSTKLCAQLDVSVARFVLQKQETSKTVLTSLSQAARVTLEEALKLQGWETREELEKALGDYPEEASPATPPQNSRRSRPCRHV